MPASTSFGRVLVGIDGSASGLDALALGRTLAGLTGVPLVLGAVHGYETLASLFGGPGWPTPEDSWQWLRRASLELGGDERFRLVTIDADSVAHGLAALADREDARLIVIGTSARSAAGQLRAGTGARRVVHAAGCPVAVAPPGWRAWTHAAHPVFGIGTNGAGEAPAALAWAGTLAAAAGAALNVLEGDTDECDDAAAARFDLLVVGSGRRGPLGMVLHPGVPAAPTGRTACPLLIIPGGSPAPPPRASGAAAAGG